ncbi:MAG: hypothetical protein JXQ71_02045, partial [Verrucomicrobia bacterium]|nr:hypothetical protein [Verrucomicrobiota bacterium]
AARFCPEDGMEPAAQRRDRVLDDRPATCALQRTNLICEQRLSRVKDFSTARRKSAIKNFWGRPY